MSSLNKEHIVDVQCKCRNKDHVVRVCVDASSKASDPTLWIYPRMNPCLGFLDRLIVAFKYVFKLDHSKKEHYDTVWVGLTDARKLSKLLDLHACLTIIRRARAAKLRRRELNANKGS